MHIPHFAHPFHLSGSGFATVEQDSAQDVAQCAFCILGTTPGQRSDFPDMGIEPPVFSEGLDMDDIREQVDTYEPRADVLPDSVLEEAAQRVTVEVALR